MSRRIFVLSEHYFPEETGTGYVLGKVCEGLASTASVHVLCAYPPAGDRNDIPRVEVRNGVTVERCSGTRLNKNLPWSRALRLLTVSFLIFVWAVWRLRRGDAVLVVTNPPALPWLAFVACKLRRARCYLRIEDLFPEALVPIGIAKAESFLIRILDQAATWLFRRVSRIIVLGRDMQHLVTQKLRLGDRRTVLITNWADVDEIRPTPRSSNALLLHLKIADRFVVQNSGNMQRSQGLEILLESARQLKQRGDIHLLLVGSGAKKKWVIENVERSALNNVTVLPPQPRQELCTLLNACDVTIISLIPGMVGISVPSRMYNCMAAGKPIIAVTDDGSELAMVVREENIGWVASPHDPQQVVNAIIQARENPALVREMGENARKAAVNNYPFQKILEAYRELFAADGFSGKAL